MFFVLPIYYKLRVTTAYEYLEQRFDLRMRSLSAVLFLIQRGMSAAIILAPKYNIVCSVWMGSFAHQLFHDGFCSHLYHLWRERSSKPNPGVANDGYAGWPGTGFF